MTQRQKSCSCIGLIFSGKAMHFYGLISKLVILLSREEIHRSNQCSAALRQKAKKKFTARGLFVSAMFHVKLIAETRVYVCHKNMKSMGFFTVFRKFSRKNLQKIFHRKWRMGGVWDSNRNYNWLCSTQSIENFISSVAGKTIVHTPKKRTVLLFFFNSKNTEIFPKLLFWSDSWVTAPVFHNRFLVINLHLMTCSSNPFKTENGHHSINLTDDVVHLQSLFKHKTWSLLKECI